MKYKNFFKYHFPVIFGCILIFILSSIPGNLFPNVDFKLSDKVVHFLIYFVLAITFYISLKNQGSSSFITRHSFFLSIIFTSLYGALDEFHQYFVPNRTCDFFDFIANSIGAVAAITIIFIILKSKSKEKFNKI